MSVVGAGEALEQALRDGAPLDAVLDVADEAIEAAAAGGDGALLAWLAEELAAAAAERGGDWSRLAIAAARARALAPRGAAPDTPQPSPSPGGEWSRIEAAAREARALAASGGALPEAAGFVDEEPAPAVVHSGWWRRVAAFAVDCVVVGVLYALFGTVRGDGDSTWYLVPELGLPLVYFAGMHAVVRGATVGKAALGIAVQTADGRAVGLVRATARAVSTFVLWLTLLGGPADVIAGAANRDRRWLHDLIAGTIVVRARG